MDQQAAVPAPIMPGGQTIEALFDEYRHDVFRYVLAMLQDYHAAEDVTQDVFLSVYRFADQYRGEASVRAWIFAIAKNTAATYWKKHHLEQPYITAQLPDSSAAVERDMNFFEILALLDPPSRDVVAMHLSGRLRHREIAAVLGETEAAVKKRYSRAIGWLRTHMKEER